MKRASVESSVVERVGYDDTRRVLEIEYKGGHVYQYFEVPPEVFKQLMEASSKGEFVNMEVKGVYEFMPL